jgi:hypothetical protein
MKTKTILAALNLVLSAAFAPQSPAQAQAADYKLDRTKLPIAEPNYPHSTVLDARDAKAPAAFRDQTASRRLFRRTHSPSEDPEPSKRHEQSWACGQR